MGFIVPLLSLRKLNTSIFFSVWQNNLGSLLRHFHLLRRWPWVSKPHLPHAVIKTHRLWVFLSLWTCSVSPAPGDPSLAGGLDLLNSRGPFHPQPFRGSEFLRNKRFLWLGCCRRKAEVSFSSGIIKYVRQQPKIFYGKNLQECRLQVCSHVIFGGLWRKCIALFQMPYTPLLSAWSSAVKRSSDQILSIILLKINGYLINISIHFRIDKFYNLLKGISINAKGIFLYSVWMGNLSIAARVPFLKGLFNRNCVPQKSKSCMKPPHLF